MKIQKGRKTKRQKDKKTRRQKDEKTKRRKQQKTKRQKDKKTKRPKRKFDIVMSGHFPTLEMFSLLLMETTKQTKTKSAAVHAR